MTVKIYKSIASGRVTAPPSKSMAHRYLICGAFSKGSIIKGIDFSNDIKATLGCLKALGAKVEIDGTTVKIGKLDINSEPLSNTLFCDESGSTLRFLIPICLLFNKEITLTGSERLFKRSLSVYEQMCKSQGIYFSLDKNSVTVKGNLSAGKYEIRGDISSQFITGMIFALSNLKDDSEINIIGKLESASYLSLTIKALADFGVRVSRIDERTIFIKGNQSYKKRELTVEGDYSNAAFLEAFNLFGGNVLVKGLEDNTAQGDRVYKEVFELLNKKNVRIDVADCPDLAPIFMAIAAAKNGASFIGTERLKIKESDRGNAMKQELSKLGCRVDIKDNEITVFNSELTMPKEAIFSHNDHRIVMAMAVLLTITGGEIIGVEAVSKSFPSFFKVLSSIGIKVEMNNEIN